ncbi:hypothetical protein PC9H_010547 [Pleurotus ostreatus]|uniref:Fungal lipase-type domain-containing protein n=1 Tax=Pleurotus ostreatus TaxID=5322 RepID=A0A8H6ZN12_PLEOS|nr:uncharacterized protein PC9H_010547 [Pleurotus ostreatus]KAF7422391.1 hypothetical protein PC9H_010547 [Pleurotus ostreatus]
MRGMRGSKGYISDELLVSMLCDVAATCSPTAYRTVPPVVRPAWTTPMRAIIVALLISLSLVTAAPAPSPSVRRLTLDPPNSITEVTALEGAQVSNYEPFSFFAKAAYCKQSLLRNWSCGRSCNQNPDFVPTLFGGDGGSIQFFYVGYWPKQDSVVVVHQGTDPFELCALLTDLNMIRTGLDETLFPGIPSEVSVHDGFRRVHAKTAVQILAEVKRLLDEKKTKNIITVGHSLGGALAALDSLYFRLNLPEDIDIRTVTFGAPRFGNEAFVKFFESKLNQFKRINHKRDVIPIVPGRFLGYMHLKGETHILGNGTTVGCPGNDNAEDEFCHIKSVPNLTKGNIAHHLGPYPGNVFMGSLLCDDTILAQAISIFSRDFESELSRRSSDRGNIDQWLTPDRNP